MQLFFSIAIKRRSSKADRKAKQVTNEVFKLKLRKATVDSTFTVKHYLTLLFRTFDFNIIIMQD